VNGPRAWDRTLAIDWSFSDESRSYRMTLSNGALVHWPDPGAGDADLTLTLTKPQLLALLAGKGMDGVQTTGAPATLQRLLGLLDEPDPHFAIVTP
jgi:alkyl sulfatase BDS1-like metallo-beta-lactamase superfamily hydrolase